MPRILQTGVRIAIALFSTGVVGLLIIDLVGAIPALVGMPLGSVPSSDTTSQTDGTGIATSPAASGGSTAPASSSTPSPTDTTDCQAGFTQVTVSHAHNRVDADLNAKFNSARAGHQDGTSWKSTYRHFLLQEAGSNAQILAIWTHALGLNDGGPNNASDLKKGDCLSAQGQKLYRTFEKALNDPDTSITLGNAPSNGYNSGIENGQFGSAATNGVTGNLKALHIKLSNGNEAYILIRCGNVDYPYWPELDVVKTDNSYHPKKPAAKPSSSASRHTLDSKVGSADPNAKDHAGPGGGRGSGLGGTPSPTQPPSTAYTPPAQPTSGSQVNVSSSSSSSHSGSGSASSSGSASASTPVQTECVTSPSGDGC